MKLSALFFISLIITLFSGCAVQPTQEELSSINYGLFPSNFKVSIDTYLNRYLKDPQSKQIEYIKGPTQGWAKGPFIGSGQLYSGYIVCAFLNAKNSFGGYTGAKPAFFMIKDEVVTLAIISKKPEDIESMQVAKLCAM